jgi:hypothetical protein
MGVDVDSEWPIVLIFLVCLIAIIWFCCHFCSGSIEMDWNAKRDWLMTVFGPMVPNLGVSFMIYRQYDFTGDLVAISLRLEYIQIGIALLQLILLGILLVLFILLIQVPDQLKPLRFGSSRSLADFYSDWYSEDLPLRFCRTSQSSMWQGPWRWISLK